MPIDSVGGPGAAGFGSLDPAHQPAATVQLGENPLSDVAQRLGGEKDALLQANPHIKDHHQKLTAGQEIFLPQSGSTEAPASADKKAGKVTFQPYSITRKMDKSSPIF